MRQIVTTGIVLARTSYGEADRILTILTPDHGKIRVIAKGARKVKSKLAGGIELFSVSQLTFIPGKSDIGTLVSTRLIEHFGTIVQELERTMLGYELLKRTNKATEDAPGEEYFTLLQAALTALNQKVNDTIVEAWFDAQLLKLAGFHPNLQTDNHGAKLDVTTQYSFDYDAMGFVPSEQGSYAAAHIKVLRLLFHIDKPNNLQNIQDLNKIIKSCLQLLTTLRKLSIRT